MSETWRRLLRRFIRLAYLLPLAYILWPIFGRPLDNRFYNYFHSKRFIPPWEDVAVIGIDRETREEIFLPPIYPISAHADQHALLLDRLAPLDLPAIVFDMELLTSAFREPPVRFAEAIRDAGNVYLVMSLREEIQAGNDMTPVISRYAQKPDSLLLEASRGAFLTDVEIDEDGCLRTFDPDQRSRRLGLTTLPEELANYAVHRAVPIVFPSGKVPIPVVSYRRVIEGDLGALSTLENRFVFVGLVEDPPRDFAAVPVLQSKESGGSGYGLHGVVILAAVTETLLRGAPIRDATPVEVFLFVLLWSAIVVLVPSMRHPIQTTLVLAAVLFCAIAAAGFFHTMVGVVFPAGFLFVAVSISGIAALVFSYIHTERILHKEEVELDRTQREMRDARVVQERFLPKVIPQVEGLDIWGVNISSLEVSGDYYDVIERDDSVLIAIADVTGKGMPASLIMSNVQAALHSHVMQERFDLAETATNMNRLISENTDAGTFVTMFLGEIDKDTGELRYVRAGHDFPLLLSRDGTITLLEEGDVFLGLLPDTRYSSASYRAERGDVLLLYTDGVTEAVDHKLEEFGVDRLSGIFCNHRGHTAGETGEAIVREVRSFSGLERQADDVTLVVVKWRGQPNP